MRSINLFENWEFNHNGPHAEPLYVNRNGRVILFTLKAGQTIREHNAPSSPFYVVIVSGRGVFAGGDGMELTVGPNMLLVFDPTEKHVIHALDELTFVGFLHSAPGAPIKPRALTQTIEI